MISTQRHASRSWGTRECVGGSAAARTRADQRGVLRPGALQRQRQQQRAADRARRARARAGLRRRGRRVFRDAAQRRAGAAAARRAAHAARGGRARVCRRAAAHGLPDSALRAAALRDVCQQPFLRAATRAVYVAPAGPGGPARARDRGPRPG